MTPVQPHFNTPPPPRIKALISPIQPYSVGCRIEHQKKAFHVCRGGGDFTIGQLFLCNLTVG